MLNDNTRRAVDQEMAMACEVWPPYLRRYFIALVKEGFTHDEALALVVNVQMYRFLRVGDH